MLTEPFERLRQGDAVRSRGRTVTESDVHAFAALTGDLHPQHCDARWATGSAFGERIAHGLLVLAFAVGLTGFAPERVLALRRIADAVFKRPVRLGDTVQVETTVADLAPATEEAGLVTLRLRIVNQHELTVCRARVEVLWRRHAPARPEPFAPDADGFVPIPL